MPALQTLKTIAENSKAQQAAMPVLFVGHGSPMNGIEDNEFSQRWEHMGRQLPQPDAVLCISAHWYIPKTLVTAMNRPNTIHDFYGFPPELFAVQYPAPGNPALARETAGLIKKTAVGLDHEWGLDHGCWSVVKKMYPDADIPVLQLSIDYTKDASWHYELARELEPLRYKRILIIGSGNMVHNLRMLDWEKDSQGFDWALEINEAFKKAISANDHQKLIHYEKFGTPGQLAIPTPDHYLPLLYALALVKKDDELMFFNDKTTMGSLSMTSLKIS